jgi:hypothetical protein
MPEIEPLQPSEWQEKIHGFLDPADDKPEHYAAIGRLVTAFNGIDAVLNWILRKQLGTDTAIARTIVGGMRTVDMLSAIKRVARLSNMEESRFKEWERLETDITEFKKIRDDAAHRIWAVKGNEFAFSNVHIARSDDAAEIRTCTVNEINDLARYARYLSERALDLFPDTVGRSQERLPSRERPRLLPARVKSQGKGQP